MQIQDEWLKPWITANDSCLSALLSACVHKSYHRPGDMQGDRAVTKCCSTLTNNNPCPSETTLAIEIDLNNTSCSLSPRLGSAGTRAGITNCSTNEIQLLDTNKVGKWFLYCQMVIKRHAHHVTGWDWDWDTERALTPILFSCWLSGSDPLRYHPFAALNKENMVHADHCNDNPQFDKLQ